jgi:hypothetical protein
MSRSTPRLYAFVVRFCYHRNIPMMIFAAYYGFTIDCNCNIAAYNLVIVGRNLPEIAITFLNVLLF